MATNISNLPISSSFQDLVIESGSILQNATGSVINNLTITSSFAITASHATNVPATSSVALRAVSASMADSASYAVSASVEIIKEVSSSYADVAGVAQRVAGGDVDGAVASASLAETASFFSGVVVSSSFAESSSFATTASHALNVPATASTAVSASFATQAGTSRLADSASVAARATTLSNLATASFADLASDARTATSASIATTAGTASVAGRANSLAPTVTATSASVAARATTLSPDATASFADLASDARTATSASVATNAGSASNADRSISASIADDIKSGIDVSFNSGSFNFLSATTASFGFLRTVTGSATIIGDEFIILNADTPTVRYAGIKVYDSGSGATASLEWDGDADSWIIAEESGKTSFIVTGPTGSRGSETSLGQNLVQKGGPNNSLRDTSITDTGALITMGLVTDFSNGARGNFSGSFEGDGGNLTNLNLNGTSSFALTASVADRATTLSPAATASFADLASDARTATSASIATTAGTASVALTLATPVVTSSYALSASNADNAATASHVLELNQDVYITGSLRLSGSLVGTAQLFPGISSGQTASLDAANYDFFEIFPPAGGGAIHVTFANRQPYQVINLKIGNGATATSMSWDSNFFAFPFGIEATGSGTGSAVDMYSFASFADQKYIGTVVHNLVTPSAT